MWSAPVLSWRSAVSWAATVAISTQRVLIGFGIGAVLGLVLGALIGLSAPVRLIAAPTIGALRAVPSLAWVPLLLLWIGIGENSKVTLVAIGAFFPVYTTVSAALAHVDPKLVEAARAFGLKGLRLFTTVQLPAVSAVGRFGSASGAGSGVAVPGRRRASGCVHGSGLSADRFAEQRPHRPPAAGYCGAGGAR